MTPRVCPDPNGCPVPNPDPATISSVKSVTRTAGRRWVTVAPSVYGASFNHSGLSNARFSSLTHPVADGSLYLAANAVSALLESALKHMWGTTPTIRLRELGGQAAYEVTVSADVEVADLRDPELSRLGLSRDKLITTSPEHYPCTRKWAVELVAAGHTGIVWHSRMAEFAASHTNAAMSEMLAAGGVNNEVVVLYDDSGRSRDSDLAATALHTSLTTGSGLDLIRSVGDMFDVPVVP